VKINIKKFMLLQPKKTKYKKVQKGKLSKLNFRSNKLKFGNIGLKAAKSATVSARQIEAARQAIVRKLSRKGKLWIRVFPSMPITSKPTEVRMGKGKGAVSHWGVKVSAGTVLFEICGVTKKAAIVAFKTGGSKLPVKTMIFL
jgi:large subunit ribosomal protein L16